MKLITHLTVAATLALSLSGCVIIGPDGDWGEKDWEETQRDNRTAIARLEINTLRSEIINRMGPPSFSEAFSQDGDDYRVLYYRTQHRKSDGETTKDETTPLVFKNEKLIGWGEKSVSSLGLN